MSILNLSYRFPPTIYMGRHQSCPSVYDYVDPFPKTVQMLDFTLL